MRDGDVLLIQKEGIGNLGHLSVKDLVNNFPSHIGQGLPLEIVMILKGRRRLVDVTLDLHIEKSTTLLHPVFIVVGGLVLPIVLETDDLDLSIVQGHTGGQGHPCLVDGVAHDLQGIIELEVDLAIDMSLDLNIVYLRLLATIIRAQVEGYDPDLCHLGVLIVLHFW